MVKVARIWSCPTYLFLFLATYINTNNPTNSPARQLHTPSWSLSSSSISFGNISKSHSLLFSKQRILLHLVYPIFSCLHKIKQQFLVSSLSPPFPYPYIQTTHTTLSGFLGFSLDVYSYTDKKGNKRRTACPTFSLQLRVNFFVCLAHT